MAGGKSKIHKHPQANTRGFDKNPQNINRKGAPRKLIGATVDELKRNGYQIPSKEQIRELYLILMNVPLSELKKMQENNGYPSLIHICANNILSGRGFEVVEKMLDRAIQLDQPNNEIEIEQATIQLPGGVIVKL